MSNTYVLIECQENIELSVKKLTKVIEQRYDNNEIAILHKGTKPECEQEMWEVKNDPHNHLHYDPGHNQSERNGYH